MKRPYEFLARWDLQTGKLQAAHVGMVNVFEEDGVTHIGAAEKVMPVSVGGSQGFPLADILKTLQITALAKADASDTALANSQQAHAQAIAEKDAVIAGLQNQIAALSAAPSNKVV